MCRMETNRPEGGQSSRSAHIGSLRQRRRRTQSGRVFSRSVLIALDGGGKMKIPNTEYEVDGETTAPYGILVGRRRFWLTKMAL